MVLNFREVFNVTFLMLCFYLFIKKIQFTLPYKNFAYTYFVYTYLYIVYCNTYDV